MGNGKVGQALGFEGLKQCQGLLWAIKPSQGKGFALQCGSKGWVGFKGFGELR
jgi:hypothetical protein